jgi:hypothetical protein
MLALSAASLGLGLRTTTPARADWWPSHTIPRVSPAYDYKTGGEYMAPPVPYGHYAKDYVGAAHKQAAMIKGHLLGTFSGLFHHGLGHGDGSGDGDGNGNGCVGPGCGGGHGLFGRHGGSGCSEPGCFGGISCGILGHQKNGGVPDGYGYGATGYATTLNGASAQAVPISSGQTACGQTGCKIGGKHSHLGHLGGHSGTGLCGDPSCGIGFAHGHGNGTGTGDGTCGFCGGKGCKHCLGKGAGLCSMIHQKLSSAAAGLLYHPKMKWFVGAGGPVPLTPGYVPYIVATRSPRDFFAFPPMNPNDP